MPSVLVPGVLQIADRAHVLGVMATFAGKPADQWLPTGHPAAKGEFAQRNWTIIAGLSSARRVEAVAVAAPNHCLDGWSYAARAIAALLSGDHHTARHLAYYAQLRAGLSLLANLGVGIFNRINYVVTASGATQRLDTPSTGYPSRLGLGTHEAVWKALDAWSSDPVTARAFLDLVTIRGAPLRDCLDAVWPGSAASGVASYLIHSWGLDLKRGKDEHVNRNVSSYVPQALIALPTTVAETLEFVDDIWTLFEPTTSSSFDKLDKYLLRGVLQRQHRLLTGNNSYSSGFMNSRYSNLPVAVQAVASLDFLVGAVEPRNPRLIRYAKQRKDPAKATEMVARAFLLLRAATAFTHASFVQAGLDLAGGALRPWIDQLAGARGFWSPAAPLLDPIDLWADIEIAMIDFNSSRNPAPQNWHDWMMRSSKGLPVVSEAERVGVWSLSA